MSQTTVSDVTETVTATTSAEAQPDLVLRLQTPAAEPRVSWATETVDNEGMGKKKSKCCCIYKKPRGWQDSSSDSDSDMETDHCRGHTEKKSGGCGGDKCQC